MKKGRKISDNSKKIIRLIKLGYSASEIEKKGFAWETVRYYFRKLKYPSKYNRFLKRVAKYNSNRAKLDK